MKYFLTMGNEQERTFNENGKFTVNKDNYIAAETEKEILRQARGRIKKIRYYLLRDDGRKAIAFDMFYKKRQEHPFYKMLWNWVRWNLFYKWRKRK